jgi:hypothetical protein
MVACTSGRFQRWFTVDSELHTAQSYAHTVNNTVHTVQYNAYANDRVIFLVVIRFVRTLTIHVTVLVLELGRVTLAAPADGKPGCLPPSNNHVWPVDM